MNLFKNVYNVISNQYKCIIYIYIYIHTHTYNTILLKLNLKLKYEFVYEYINIFKLSSFNN